LTIEDYSSFSIEEAGNKSIQYNRTYMIFINQFNIFKNLVKNYINLQKNRNLLSVHTPDVLIQKLDSFIDRTGLTNKR